MTRARILVVEDDPSILSGLEAKLQLEGYDVEAATDGAVAIRRLEDAPFDLLILDLMLPEVDGMSLLRWLRQRPGALPVLILSAKGAEHDKVDGLRAGADDYLAKPFGLGELLARIEALLRRARGPTATIELGDITLDIERGLAFRDGQELALSPKEAAILFYLARHADRIVPREEIQNAVWGYYASSSARAVDYHVLGLRRKIEDDPAQPTKIVTKHGRGYQLVVG